ncbi:MAG TPA: hypothetical protein VEU73_06190 [Gemmatimonadales bacterium]|nr:hypothetical protein [Gemmatimonadales bacterium]
MRDAKRFEPDACDPHRMARAQDSAVGDRITDAIPRLASGVDGTGSSQSQPSCVIGMRVRQNDRVRAQPRHSVEPVFAAVDHHSRVAIGDNRGAVMPMARGGRLGVAAGPEKDESQAWFAWHAPNPGLVVLIPKAN